MATNCPSSDSVTADQSPSGFGLYLASSGKYEDQILPTGMSASALRTPSTALVLSAATDPRRTYRRNR